MIHTKEELQHYLQYEDALYRDKFFLGRLKQRILKDPKLLILRFLKVLRKEGYYHNQTGFYSKIIYQFYHRKRNVLGQKLGIEIWDRSFQEGLRIEHAGNIVVNGHARIGKNCILHGSNCIGNTGLSSECPSIGDNVRIGVGAKIIGGITLADNIIVAAGAVVVHSFNEAGITIAGIPARKVKKHLESIYSNDSSEDDDEKRTSIK